MTNLTHITGDNGHTIWVPPGYTVFVYPTSDGATTDVILALPDHRDEPVKPAKLPST